MRPAVFATERMDVAALFMVPIDALVSIGFEQDIAYICIWGTPEEFVSKDVGGFVYVLPSEGFEKIGKGYEWQCFGEVISGEVRHFDSVVAGMIGCGAQAYFINDDTLFDAVVANKDQRAPILKKLISENQRRHASIRQFKL